MSIIVSIIDNYFLKQKYASLQKYSKIKKHIFVFALMNAAHCIREQNKKGVNGYINPYF